MTSNPRPSWSRSAGSALLILLGACSGEAVSNSSGAGGAMAPAGPGSPMGMAMPGGSGAPPGTSTPDPGAEAGPPCSPASRSFAPARIWQLTDKQYVNVVRDVLDIALSEEDGKIVSAGAADRYTNYSEGIAIDTQVAPNYQTVAVKVADLAATPARLTALTGAAAPSAEQMRGFITGKLARLWRRPVSEAEQAALLKLFTDAQPDGAARGVHLVIEAALQAPAFLYRTELGSDAASARAPLLLTQHELASALSFLFLDSAPDDALWARAEAGTLYEPAVLSGEVDRLMALPQARANLALRATYWLGLAGISNRSRSATLYPEWTESIKNGLAESVQLFVSDVLANGKLSDLFTSNRVYLNRALARLYGIQGVPQGSGLMPVAVPGSQRSAGILSQPGLIVAANKLVDRGDVVHRGLLVNSAFVCGGSIPPAPPEAGDEAKKMDGTERQRANARAMKPGCAACHMKFDPLGLAFERYDALGRYDESRQAVLDSTTGETSWQNSPGPIDATSEIVDDGQGDKLAGPVDGLAGPAGLAAKLAASPARVGRCASRKLAEYALGFNPDAENSCELKAVKQVLIQTGSFTQFFRALALSPGFRTRNPNPVAAN